MKTKKLIVSILFIITLCQFIQAEKRTPRLLMADLTDPSSPSYLPFPYPETRKEIIADLKYQLNRMYSHKERWEYASPDTINLLPELIKENSNIIVSDIEKIKNRISGYADNYSYLVFLEDVKNKYVTRVALKANGLFIGGIDPSPKNRGKKLKSFNHCLKKIARYLGKSHKELKVKKKERVAIDFYFSPPPIPITEFVLEDGSKYYVTYKEHLYKVIMEKYASPAEKSSMLKTENLTKEKDEVIITDTINDTIIRLKRLNLEE